MRTRFLWTRADGLSNGDDFWPGMRADIAVSGE